MNTLEKMRANPMVSEIAKALDSGNPAKIKITPGMATTILSECNETNRQIRKIWAESLANDIMGDMWRDNGDTVSFYEDGMLADGQHRLSAITMANKSIDVIVTGGITKEAMLTKDTGHQRTADSALAMYGYQDARELATVAKHIYQWKHYGKPGGTAPTHMQLKLYVDQYEGSITEATQGAMDFLQDRPKKLTLGDIGPMLWKAKDRGYDPDTLRLFLSDVIDGTSTSDRTPEAQVTKALDAAYSKKHAMSALRRVGMCVKAFNLHIEGKESVSPGSVVYKTTGKGRDKVFPDFVKAEEEEQIAA